MELLSDLMRVQTLRHLFDLRNFQRFLLYYCFVYFSEIEHESLVFQSMVQSLVYPQEDFHLLHG